METNPTGYRIDYENLDVVDLVSQIQERVRRTEAALLPPGVQAERARSRLRTYVNLDTQALHRLQRELRLEGDWNVTPEDLRRSDRPGLGVMIRVLRRLSQPLLKLMANFDLPVYKQHKINVGIAKALNDLLRETAELRGRIEELASRLERLELQDRGVGGREAYPGAGVDEGSGT